MSLLPRAPSEPKAPAPEDRSVSAFPKSNDVGDTLKSVQKSIESKIDDLTEATSVRRLSSFAEEEIAHEETDVQLDLTIKTAAQIDKPRRRRVQFEKSAGARATRSQNPTVVRGLGTSIGYMTSAIGMSVAASAFALGTTNLFDEFAQGKSSTLRAALHQNLAQLTPRRRLRHIYSRATKQDGRLRKTRSSRTTRPTAAGSTSTPRNFHAGAGSASSSGSKRSSATALSSLGCACKAVCRQVAGVDYDQTWCGAMRGTSLRTLSNLAALGGMRMRRTTSWPPTCRASSSRARRCTARLRAQGPQSAVRGADRCDVCCEVTLTSVSIDADDIFGILSAS